MVGLWYHILIENRALSRCQLFVTRGYGIVAMTTYVVTSDYNVGTMTTHGFDNLRCHQWRKSYHYENVRSSILIVSIAVWIPCLCSITIIRKNNFLISALLYSRIFVVSIFTSYCPTLKITSNKHLLYTPHKELVGGILGSLRPSICPSVQFWLDPFHIHTSYQATSESVSRVKFLAKF